MKSPDSPIDRRLACLLGGAIGDALGYRVEFERWPEIERRYGASGIQLTSATGPLVVSDDTQMTLFTLERMSRSTGGSRQCGVRRAFRCTSIRDSFESVVLANNRLTGDSRMDKLSIGNQGLRLHN